MPTHLLITLKQSADASQAKQLWVVCRIWFVPALSFFKAKLMSSMITSIELSERIPLLSMSSNHLRTVTSFSKVLPVALKTCKAMAKFSTTRSKTLARMKSTHSTNYVMNTATLMRDVPKFTPTLLMMELEQTLTISSTILSYCSLSTCLKVLSSRSIASDTKRNSGTDFWYQLMTQISRTAPWPCDISRETMLAWSKTISLAHSIIGHLRSMQTTTITIQRLCAPSTPQFSCISSVQLVQARTSHSGCSQRLDIQTKKCVKHTCVSSIEDVFCYLNYQ